MEFLAVGSNEPYPKPYFIPIFLPGHVGFYCSLSHSESHLYRMYSPVFQPSLSQTVPPRSTLRAQAYFFFFCQRPFVAMDAFASTSPTTIDWKDFLSTTMPLRPTRTLPWKTMAHECLASMIAMKNEVNTKWLYLPFVCKAELVSAPPCTTLTSAALVN